MLFLSGMNADESEDFFKANFSSDILQAAVAKRFLGGVFDPKKAGAVERFMVKVVTKKSGYINTIDDEAIARFAEDLRT